jgi:hypothetical protein
MTLYELGQCYRFGWGVRKSSSASAVYFRLAADLGDMDAQMDVAACYMTGKGAPKNEYLAAAYIRIASLNGGKEFGTSWAYKPKYDVYFRDHFPEFAIKEDKASGRTTEDAIKDYQRAKVEAEIEDAKYATLKAYRDNVLGFVTRLK